jgi:hypothetical protein
MKERKETPVFIRVFQRAAYDMALPKSKQRNPEWQTAGEAVIMAAEDGGPLSTRALGCSGRRTATSNGLSILIERTSIGGSASSRGTNERRF